MLNNEMPRMMDLGMASFNPPGELPFGPLAPQSIVIVSQVRFKYVGPVVKLAVGAAWKPAQGVSIPFNNGGKVALNPFGGIFGSVGEPFLMQARQTAPENPEVFNLEDLSVGVFASPILRTPASENHVLLDGSVGSFIDKTDAWLWAINVTAMEQALGAVIGAVELNAGNMVLGTNEQFFLVNTTEGEIFSIA